MSYGEGPIAGLAPGAVGSVGEGKAEFARQAMLRKSDLTGTFNAGIFAQRDFMLTSPEPV
jgi:hypothetical protein